MQLTGMKNIYVAISEFTSAMGYCEIKIVNKFHLDVKPVITQYQVAGKKIHKDLEDQDKLLPREKATEQQLKDPAVDLDFPRETNFISIERLPFVYVGRIDKVVRQGGDIVIIDDRVSKNPLTSGRPFPDKLMQLSCYCEGFIQNYAKTISFNRMMFKFVQRNQEGDVVFDYQQEYDDAMKSMLLEKMQRFEDIVNKNAEPNHCNNAKKCAACSYFTVCKFRLEA